LEKGQNKNAWYQRSSTDTRDLEEQKRGLAATARLIELLEDIDNEFILVSHGVGKFGRCLGDIRVDDHSINKQLITEGHGTEYYGGKR
jgi:endonuclease YncB( thermonuclease family)